MQINDLVSESLKGLKYLGIYRKIIPGGAEVLLRGSVCKLLLNMDQIEQGNGGFSAVGSFSIEIGDGYIIEDLIVGYGSTAEEAVLSSIDQIVVGVLAPIAAFNADFNTEGWNNQITNFAVGGSGWNFVLGEVASNDATGDLHAVLDLQAPLINIFTPIAQYVYDRKDLRPHWIFAFLARYPDGSVDGHVRIDNELDQEAYNALRQFNWPTDQPLIWFRQFGVLEPSVQTERRHQASSAAQNGHQHSEHKTASFLSKLIGRAP